MFLAAPKLGMGTTHLPNNFGARPSKNVANFCGALLFMSRRHKSRSLANGKLILANTDEKRASNPKRLKTTSESE